MVDVKKKLLLLGDGAVGKTSLVRRFVLDTFEDRYITTIGAKVTKKDINFKVGGEPLRFSMMLWDVLGQQGYSNIQKASFSGADGALLVCDVTRAATLNSLEKYWVPHVKEVAGDIPFLLLANKADLTKRELGPQELFEAAAKFNSRFFFTSAKNGMNVNLAFYKLAYGIVKNMEGGGDVSSVDEQYRPVLEEKEQYTAIEVADMIMTDFCAADEMVDIDDTMDILVPQFDRAGVDVKNPTRAGLGRVVENLSEMESLIKDEEEVNMNRSKRMSWVERIAE